MFVCRFVLIVCALLPVPFASADAPLHEAAKDGTPADIVRLVAEGADANKRDENGECFAGLRFLEALGVDAIGCAGGDGAELGGVLAVVAEADFVAGADFGREDCGAGHRNRKGGDSLGHRAVAHDGIMAPSRLK